MQAGLGRNDRRTIVGGRWEHDFDNTTTWRNQFVFDDRNISQPTGATSAIGDFPSYNYMSDVTKRGEIFGLESTTYFGAFYNTLTASSDYAQSSCRAATPRSGRLQSNTWSDTIELRRSRARGTEADAATDGGCRHRMGNHASEGDQFRLQLRIVAGPESDDHPDDRRPAIPEHRARARAALQAESRVAVPGACRHRIRNAAGRKPLRPFERSERQQYAAQDAKEPRLRSRLRLDAEQRAQVQRDRLLRILPQRTGHAGDTGRAPNASYTFNAPTIGASRGRTGRRLEVLSRLAIHRGLYLSRSVLHRIHRRTSKPRRRRHGLQLQPRGQQDSRHLAERTDGAAWL